MQPSNFNLYYRPFLQPTSWALLILVLLLASNALSCELCNESGVKADRAQRTLYRQEGGSSERITEISHFCSCDAGKALARDAHPILFTAILDLEAKISEWDNALRGWKSRLVQNRSTEQALQKDLNALRSEKADVRDMIQKASHRLDQAKTDVKVAEESSARITQDLAKARSQLEAAKQLMEQVKQRLAESSEKPPPPQKRKLPEFGLTTVADLRAAVNIQQPMKTPESPDGQPAPAAKKNLKLYVLKDGREIRTKVSIDHGDEITLKGEDGKMIKIKKDEIDHFVEE